MDGEWENDYDAAGPNPMLARVGRRGQGDTADEGVQVHIPPPSQKVRMLLMYSFSTGAIHIGLGSATDKPIGHKRPRYQIPGGQGGREKGKKKVRCARWGLTGATLQPSTQTGAAEYSTSLPSPLLYRLRKPIVPSPHLVHNLTGSLAKDAQQCGTVSARARPDCEGRARRSEEGKTPNVLLLLVRFGAKCQVPRGL